MFLYILLALLAGVTIVLSRIINSNLAKEIGLFQSTFFNFLTGFIFSAIVLFFAKENLNIAAISKASIPFYAYIGGFIGIFSITLSNYIAPKISAFYMTLLIFIGQLSIGIAADYFMLNELSIGKIIGGIIVSLGLSYNLYIDKQDSKSN